MTLFPFGYDNVLIILYESRYECPIMETIELIESLIDKNPRISYSCFDFYLERHFSESLKTNYNLKSIHRDELTKKIN